MRYTFVLDATETLNFFGFKIMSHTLKNNFKVFNPTDLDDDSQPYIHMSDYQALIVGIERSFQITPAISLLASLDFLSIQNTKSDTSQEFEKSGLGFQVRGEVFYRMDLLGVPGRMGLMYWQGAYTNEVKNVDDASSENENLGRSTHVQSFRNITLGYSIWY
ncbi:MAG: hypothetical protein KDD25_09240 [Bdellovibrionales bacterium]|nr:hypothetical protein [Bdellovibrionales bacterium]